MCESCALINGFSYRILQVEISHEEMQQLVETLYFDGKVDKRIADGREQYEEGVVYYACSKNPVRLHLEQ